MNPPTVVCQHYFAWSDNMHACRHGKCLARDPPPFGCESELVTVTSPVDLFHCE